MRMKVNDKNERLEVSLYFPDSRVIDLELALHLVSKQQGWRLIEHDKRFDHVEYVVNGGGAYLATVEFMHGFEPPTRALFHNKGPDAEESAPANKQSVIRVLVAFLEECAERILVSDVQKEEAVAELKRHDKVEV